MSSESARSGLATWRARQAAEKQLALMELEHYRQFATEEVRDGRTYKVVRIPDMYDFARRPEPKPESHFRRHSVQLAHDLTRGVNPSSSGGSPP